MPIATHAARPRFFATPAAFRRWLRANHSRKTELWVGFHKRATGTPSITWPESVDEALCVGWIDGLRKSLDDDRYMIRFTPRKTTSTWSAVNQRRMAVLIAEGRVLPAGQAAFDARREDRSGIYSYENRSAAAFDADLKATFRGNPKAWEYFSRQPPSYRKTATWWVISAKQPVTRERRLAKLIQHSAAHEWIPSLQRTKPKR